MSPWSRRRFTRMMLGMPLALLVAMPARSNPIEALLASAQAPRHSNELWVLVDDAEATLSVYRGHALIERFFPVSLGRSGAKPQRLRGGNVTPLGEFRVNRFNHDSHWHIFIGIDYPTAAHARMALESGVFTEGDYEDFMRHLARHGQPPQNTALGGAIGIHGIGRGDPEIHSRFHWTQGCVAVTNEQIERLAELVDIGTRIVIR
ncbi:L,D-transpeptidase family protein [Thioalkalivibrio paradoxus]|uniref:L,D-TPase catalytic domain-containing protein n=1 Tax=Thioalkalivibrio paradoxus ARh 1 TaxID=713585 RepID=W0DHS4_9GAMM|nr:L,D-transpeptidase [Thioalkalivibrio paradoxus]AHE97971.1 hypothetical protein THITH_06545 [Thioalkalivibrio paradoxus ARh 1]